MNINLVRFNTDVGKNKPENMRNKNNACPFCDVEHLTNIIDVDEDIIFLKNKYIVVENSEQFVLIEGKECKIDMPGYSKNHMRRVIKMGVKHWKNLLDSGKFEEVLFFKNFGPMSGGTIRHPHMQIVAFPKLKSELLFDIEELRGLVIAQENDVELNISNCPRVGFGELNVIADDCKSLDTFADFLQIGVHYIMNFFRKNLDSYNIFFYHRDKKIYAKIMPRVVTSPYFVGYNIHFLPRNIYRIAEEVKTFYFGENRKITFN